MRIRFLESASIDRSTHKKKQFEIIQATNPMLDPYHVGIRSVKDIKFPEEVFSQQGWSEDDPGNTEEIYPDWLFKDGQKALSKKKITVYSSNPIKNGTFVTPSKMNALCYGTSVNKKTMSIYDIAWINSEEGQVAIVDDYEKIVNANESMNLNEMVRVLNNDRIHKSIDSYLKRVKGVSSHFKSYFDDMFTDSDVILLRPREASIYLSDGQLGTHCQTRGILIITGVRRSRASEIWTDFIHVYRSSTRLKDGMALFGKLEIKHKDKEELNTKISKKIRQIVKDLALVIDDNKKLAMRMKALGLSVEKWTVKDGIDPGYLKKAPKGYSEMDEEIEGLVLEESEKFDLKSLIDELNSLPVVKDQNVSSTLQNRYKEVLSKFPIGKKIKRKIDAGFETFTKVKTKGKIDYWEYFYPQPGFKTMKKSFEIAQYMAGSQKNARGKFQLNEGISFEEGLMKEVALSIENLNSATDIDEIKSTLETIPAGTSFIRKDGRVIDNIGRVDEDEWILLKAENLNVSSKTIDSLAKWMVSKIGQGKYIFKEGKNLKESSSPRNLIKELNDFPMKRGVSKVKYEDIKKVEAILADFPIGTVISHKVDCGIEKYEKIEKDRWIHFWPIARTEHKQFAFDTARWMAGLDKITRGPFVLEK